MIIKYITINEQILKISLNYFKFFTLCEKGIYITVYMLYIHLIHHIVNIFL